jgi:hypothetical protein
MNKLRERSPLRVRLAVLSEDREVTVPEVVVPGVTTCGSSYSTSCCCCKSVEINIEAI